MYEVEFLILSDHNTVKGSLDIAKKIKSKGLSIVCPPAAEYKTELGDIILVGLPYDLKSPKFEDLVKISQNNNCKLLFPHPYHDHTKIEYLASKVDFIEVFNSRCSLLENEKAEKLAKLTRKNTYASPDAHTISEYKNCIISYKTEDNSCWIKILDQNWHYCTKDKTTFCHIYVSSFIKSLKKKSIMVFIKSLIKICIFCTFFKKFR